MSRTYARHWTENEGLFGFDKVDMPEPTPRTRKVTITEITEESDDWSLLSDSDFSSGSDNDELATSETEMDAADALPNADTMHKLFEEIGKQMKTDN